MSDPDVVFSYEDLIAQYNVNWNMSDKQLGIGRGLSADGKAYTILNHYSEKSDWVGKQSVPMAGTMIYRKDIYDALGSPSIKNFDELFSLFQKVKDGYPEIDAVLKLNSTWNTAVVKSLAGAGSGDLDFIEQSGGKYLFYTRDTRYKEYIKWLNKCWQAGFLSPDESYFVTGSEVPPAGKYFMTASSTQNSLPGAQTDNEAAVPGALMTELMPFANSDYTTSDTGWSGTFITKNNKNPEVSIKFIAWMFGEEAQKLTQMGRPGIEYTLNSEGLPEFSDAWVAANKDGTLNTIYNTWFYLGGSEIVEADSRCATLDYDLVGEPYKFIREHFDNQPWVSAARPVASTDERVVYDKIKDITKTYEARIIMAGSDSDFESLFAEYLSNIEKTGIAGLEDFMTTRIGEVMPLYK
jgi:putative aldouronate transport system substrate-binding protein